MKTEFTLHKMMDQIFLFVRTEKCELHSQVTGMPRGIDSVALSACLDVLEISPSPSAVSVDL